MISGQYYLNSTIPLTIKLNNVTGLCPILTVGQPDGSIVNFDTTTGVTLMEVGNVTISNDVYQYLFTADQLGTYVYSWRIIDCTNQNDLTCTSACLSIPAGGFVVIRNPLDETVSEHLLPGTLGRKIYDIEAYLRAFNYPGDGECHRQIKVKGMVSSVGFLYDAETGKQVATSTGVPVGKYDSLLNFYINTGTYRVRIIDPSNCNTKPIDKIITVKCGDDTTQCA